MRMGKDFKKVKAKYGMPTTDKNNCMFMRIQRYSILQIFTKTHCLIHQRLTRIP
jgi:hypothetical protein